jgi:hypothetical protein
MIMKENPESIYGRFCQHPLQGVLLAPGNKLITRLLVAKCPKIKKVDTTLTLPLNHQSPVYNLAQLHL